MAEEGEAWGKLIPKFYANTKIFAKDEVGQKWTFKFNSDVDILLSFVCGGQGFARRNVN